MNLDYIMFNKIKQNGNSENFQQTKTYGDNKYENR